jgi:hypothetical protein
VQVSEELRIEHFALDVDPQRSALTSDLVVAGAIVSPLKLVMSGIVVLS